jgi:cell wall-associated NlpC family hydrolase
MGSTAAILQVTIALLSVGGGDRAASTLGDSLAMVEARHRVESAPAAHPRKSAPQPDLPSAEEIAADPSLLPPASAGSNGTHLPHRSSGLSREEIFAHSRGGSDSTAILLTGVALAPPDAPEPVQGAINAANTIVGRPYVWGGGHASFYSDSYDCSGAVSFALHGGGLLDSPLDSTGLETWGVPGAGSWITVYANSGHAWAVIAGLRWDTSGDVSGSGPRWHTDMASTAGFIARHPSGY